MPPNSPRERQGSATAEGKKTYVPPQVYDEDEDERRMREGTVVEEGSTDVEELQPTPRPRRTFRGAGRRGALPTLGTNDENKENEGL